MRAATADSEPTQAGRPTGDVQLLRPPSSNSRVTQELGVELLPRREAQNVAIVLKKCLGCIHQSDCSYMAVSQNLEPISPSWVDPLRSLFCSLSLVTPVDLPTNCVVMAGGLWPATSNDHSELCAICVQLVHPPKSMEAPESVPGS